jgi:hypothetical protein
MKGRDGKEGTEMERKGGLQSRQKQGALQTVQQLVPQDKQSKASRASVRDIYRINCCIRPLWVTRALGL